ncbi:hypothetical protein NTE19_003346 [Vibrio fluvialis]|nr:hypothetical protein [Vibrio fluvialis]
MALDKGGLKALVITEMEAVGFVTKGQHAWAEKLAQAVANAVVQHIQANAEVPINSGSSAGTYKVQ